MTASYQHLALAQVQVGMILSDELLDVQGQILLPQGTVLTAAMLALMPRHGISMLAVLAPAESPEQQAAARLQRQQRLDHLFRRHDADSIADADWASTLLRNYVAHFRLGDTEAP